MKTLAVSHLNLALKERGLLTLENSQSLQDFAKELRAISAVSETEILQAEAMALNMGADVEGAKVTVWAAIDYAAAENICLDSAIREMTICAE